MIYAITDTTCVEGEGCLDALEKAFRVALALPPQPRLGFSAADNAVKLHKWKADCRERRRQFYYQLTQQRRGDVNIADAFVAYLVRYYAFVSKPYEQYHVV